MYASSHYYVCNKFDHVDLQHNTMSFDHIILWKFGHRMLNCQVKLIWGLLLDIVLHRYYSITITVSFTITLAQFRLFCCHPLSKKLIEKHIEVHRYAKLSDAVAEAHKVKCIMCNFVIKLFNYSVQLHNLEGVVPVDHCHLVRYDEYTETLDQSFDDTLVCIHKSPLTYIYI